MLGVQGDVAAQNPELRLPEMQTYLAKYNGLGQLVEETSFDHGDGFEGQQLSMTTRFSYGPWGELTKTTYPDQTCRHSAYTCGISCTLK
ncbi:RHS repeat domain-containing protein [Pseudomonas asiatica]|uniref:RHS repeat domain-containing protein n=1 Tax=Pseudomonas asiatica TaxID=2219225 RepID=UPI0037C914E7